MPNLKLTVVAPVFNEEEVIAHFYARTSKALRALTNVDAEILFVVDRCTDNTVDVLRRIIAGDASARALILSTRFGHQASLMAGIEDALNSDAIIMMDSDLQHPPELIPVLLEKFLEGFDIVYTVRTEGADVPKLRRIAGDVFYWLLTRLSRVPVRANAADFRLISRRVARHLVGEFGERNLFLRGIFSWVGFNQAMVEYQAARRLAGTPKYSLMRTLRLAVHGVLSFSTTPLYLALYVGFSMAALGFAFMLFNVAMFFVDRSIPSGWTTIVTVLLLFMGMQFIVLGIIGAYIGGLVEEVKRRPRYLVDERIAHHD